MRAEMKPKHQQNQKYDLTEMQRLELIKKKKGPQFSQKEEDVGGRSCGG